MKEYVNLIQKIDKFKESNGSDQFPFEEVKGTLTSISNTCDELDVLETIQQKRLYFMGVQDKLNESSHKIKDYMNLIGVLKMADNNQTIIELETAFLDFNNEFKAIITKLNDELVSNTVPNLNVTKNDDIPVISDIEGAVKNDKGMFNAVKTAQQQEREQLQNIKAAQIPKQQRKTTMNYAIVNVDTLQILSIFPGTNDKNEINKQLAKVPSGNLTILKISGEIPVKTINRVAI